MTNLKITTCSPATCKCIIEYEWDFDLPLEQRVHKARDIIKQCSEHSGLNKDELQEVIFNEYLKLQDVTIELLKINDLAEDVIQEDGVTIRQFKKGIINDWHFDMYRNLEIRIRGTNLKQPDKDNLQILADSKYGFGKVKML